MPGESVAIQGPILGIDFHDTFTYAPNFFVELIKQWKGKRYIVTGTPERDRSVVRVELQRLGVYPCLDGLLMGYDYEKGHMTESHFHRMARHKLGLIRKYGIQVYFDDNPYYVSFLKDHGIIVFQTIVSPEYLEEYRKRDCYFTGHLQENQFSFLQDQPS